ncbi:hypothetical protein B0J14DRAFT_594030 [Halenospora varia]|nr:hypothetical protein B0J14DRAFT_594030 [Halenospora varia]
MLTLGKQFPFLDRSHDREGSFIPPANYRVPAENLGYSPESRASLRKPELETKYESRPLNPYIYSPLTSSWHPFKPVPREGGLSQGRSLRVVSWNIYFEGPDLESRGSSAMARLKEIFGDSPTPMVIILQGVHHQSLEAICVNLWIRENFVLSNVKAPQPCFTLVMASREIQAESWFRVTSPLERDALVVDIPISSL